MTQVNTVSANSKSLVDIATYKRNDKHYPLPNFVDLTKKRLIQDNLENTTISALQVAIPRIRESFGYVHELNGSGFVIDPSGFIITNHHIIGARKGNLFVDFPILSQDDLPVSFTPNEVYNGINNDQKRSIDIFPIPYDVIAEDPMSDLVLLAPLLDEFEDAWKRIKLLPRKPKNEEAVFAIGHRDCLRHNSISAGKIILNDLNFDNRNDEIDKQIARANEQLNAANLILPRNRSIWSSNKLGIGFSGGILCDEYGNAYGVLCQHSRNEGNNEIPKYMKGKPEFDVDYIKLGLPYTTKNITVSIGIEERVFPFFENFGINPNDVLDGKSLNFSNIIYRKYKRALK